MTSESHEKPDSRADAHSIPHWTDSAAHFSVSGEMKTPVKATSDSGGPDDKDTFGFLDHLEELRWRLLKIIIGVVIAGSVALFFGQELFAFIVKPLGDLQLHVTSITGSFYAYMVVSIFAGLFAIMPYVFYQLWAFIAPGLYKTEKRVILPAVAASSALFVFGAWFCYRYVLPLAISYLVSFGEGALTPIITVGSYLSFAGMMILAFGATFNMPVVSFFLAKMNLLQTDTLARGRRVAVVAILILAAIITPPDIFTQILIGAPMYLLFEISIVVVRLVNHQSEEQAP